MAIASSPSVAMAVKGNLKNVNLRRGAMERPDDRKLRIQRRFSSKRVTRSSAMDAGTVLRRVRNVSEWNFFEISPFDKAHGLHWKPGIGGRQIVAM